MSRLLQELSTPCGGLLLASRFRTWEITLSFLLTITKQMSIEILSSEPWSFDNHMVMQLYEKDSAIEELSINQASFWVQLPGIPMQYLTMEAAVKISSVIGEVIRPINPKETDGGNFIRLKVTIDLSLPLC